MSGGAIRATTACDVGIQSISPMTNTKMTTATTGNAPVFVSARNGSPISRIAVDSFTEAGTCAVRAVMRNWKSVTMIGLTTTRNPHVDGARPCESTSEIGSSVSYATYTSVEKVPE